MWDNCPESSFQENWYPFFKTDSAEMQCQAYNSHSLGVDWVNKYKKYITTYDSYEYLNLIHLVVSNSATPWTLAHQDPLSVGFPRQENWSGLSFPPPEDLSDPGTEHMSLMSPALAGGFFPAEPSGKSHITTCDNYEYVHTRHTSKYIYIFWLMFVTSPGETVLSSALQLRKLSHREWN